MLLFDASGRGGKCNLRLSLGTLIKARGQDLGPLLCVRKQNNVIISQKLQGLSGEEYYGRRPLFAPLNFRSTGSFLSNKFERFYS